MTYDEWVRTARDISVTDPEFKPVCRDQAIDVDASLVEGIRLYESGYLIAARDGYGKTLWHVIAAGYEAVHPHREKAERELWDHFVRDENGW